MRNLLALCLTLSATPCAAWNVSTTKDRMTDKTLTWASATSGEATLLVGCLNGQVQPRLSWGKRIGWGDIGISYRFDDGPVVPRFATVSQEETVLYPWIGDYSEAVARFRKGKRLRSQCWKGVLRFRHGRRRVVAGDQVRWHGYC